MTDTTPNHAALFLRGMGEAIANDRVRADIASCRHCGPGNGNRPCDCHHADAQRLDEIDAYLASPAAHWAPCGTLDALDDERAELQRRIEDRRIANTRNAQH